MQQFRLYGFMMQRKYGNIIAAKAMYFTSVLSRYSITG